MTVTYPDGTRQTFAVSNGVLMQARSIDNTFNPAKGVKSGIREPYDKAEGKGFAVQLHSKAELGAGATARARRKGENASDIAKAEMQPNAGRAGIAASRLLSRPGKRGR